VVLVKSCGYDSVLKQNLKGNNFESRLVCGLQDDRARRPGPLHLQPAASADAPTVSWLEPGKAELRHRGGEIISEPRGGSEKLFSDDAAHGMHAQVVRAGVAAAITVEACDGVESAGFEDLAENIFLRCELRAGGRHGQIVVSAAGSCSLGAKADSLRE
jgi:hypothetical protein